MKNKYIVCLYIVRDVTQFKYMYKKIKHVYYNLCIKMLLFFCMSRGLKAVIQHSLYQFPSREQNMQQASLTRC